jgi:hypothetical protein
MLNNRHADRRYNILLQFHACSGHRIPEINLGKTERRNGLWRSGFFAPSISRYFPSFSTCGLLGFGSTNKTPDMNSNYLPFWKG